MLRGESFYTQTTSQMEGLKRIVEVVSTEEVV